MQAYMQSIKQHMGSMGEQQADAHGFMQQACAQLMSSELHSSWRMGGLYSTVLRHQRGQE
eukprot:6482709-Amphidinium_carterae.3